MKCEEPTIKPYTVHMIETDMEELKIRSKTITNEAALRHAVRKVLEGKQ